MKVPPEKPPTYEKDRNITRRTVKGAAGGMLGVDYEDDRAPDPRLVKATTGAGANRDAVAAEVAADEAVAIEAEVKRPRRITAPKEESEMVLDDEDATTRDEKAKRRNRGVVSRDRMTVDKDPPQRLRKPQWYADDEDPPEEPDEIDLDALAAEIAGAGRALEDRRAFIGDPRLTDPLAIKEALGSPVAYAKHCMILAEAFRSTTGATRPEAVAYLTLMFAALGDRPFARQALKELGLATGIIDLYPLEVVEHAIEAYPGLLPKFGFGTLFSRPESSETLELSAGIASELLYPASLKIRGFAIKGGARPGYRFEPSEEEGRYRLTIFAPGRYRLLISATTRSGHTVLDRIEVNVADTPGALPPMEATAVARDEAKVAAWPKPDPVPLDPARLLEEEQPPKREDSSGMLSMGERISLQQRDALKVSFEERVLGGEVIDPDDGLSRAEASLLKVAVVLSTAESDLNLVDDDGEG